MPMKHRVFTAALVALLVSAGQSAATELLIRVAPPPGYPQRVHLRSAQLLLAWWGDTTEVPLAHRYEGDDLIVGVPLDSGVWQTAGAAQPPDFAYVYLEFDDFVPVRSGRFYWIGAAAPAPSPVNWQTVTAVHFAFPGGDPVTIRAGDTREVSLRTRRPESRHLRIVDDVGRPVSDITVDGGMFWSAHNHCGFPEGLKPLFAGRRPDRDGTVPVPDGVFDYGFGIDGIGHASIVAPAAARDLFFVSAFEAPELVVRIRRHARVPLRIRVSIAGKPAAGVAVGAAVHAACGNGAGTLGRTDVRGALLVSDFYPEEFEAICIAAADGRPVWAAAPPPNGTLTIDLPAGVHVGDIQYCYLPARR